MKNAESVACCLFPVEMEESAVPFGTAIKSSRDYQIFRRDIFEQDSSQG